MAGEKDPTVVPPRVTAHWFGSSVVALRDAIDAAPLPVALVLGIARLGEAELRGGGTPTGSAR